jgi:RNA polymerase sigma-70 factor (ECF subfamily)
MNSFPLFEDMITDFSTEIFSYLWRLTQNAQDAEDALQDTYLRAYRAYPGVRKRTLPGERFYARAWLYRIATNVANTHLKRRARYEGQTTLLEERLHSSGHRVPDQVQDRLNLLAVHQAVESLPEKQRAALILRKYQSLEYAEIAATLSCTESAARANVYQAVKRLREQFPDVHNSLKERS